ncbi:MAG: carbohydrate ABC transporter permease, partial [Gammaproteobacteria bacterium]
YAPGPEGPMNAFLGGATFGSWRPVDFLRDPGWALPAIMLLSVWQGVGFQMVILLAGLQAIPRELYEAAALDGAGPWGRFFGVTLPQLRNPLVFVMLITTILALRLFDQVQIMTRGGPDNATTTVMYEITQAVFTRGQVARACAMTVVFFLAVLALTWLQRRIARQEREVQ